MSRDTGISVRNYKSFGSDHIGFPATKHLNIIIGKNNVGKSSLIDAIEFAITKDPRSTLSHQNIVFCSTVNENDLTYLFNPLTSGLNPELWETEGKPLVGETLYWIERGKHNDRAIVSKNKHYTPEQEEILKRYSKILSQNLTDLSFIRILAERDIKPERAVAEIHSQVAKSVFQSLHLENSGEGATQVIQYLIHRVHDHREIITRKLLDALNEIFCGETKFSEITARQYTDSDLWEIFLSEENSKLHALSKSGSGLKTIILILLNVIARPLLERRSISNYCFSIEEIENNLHPSLQRSLLSYIENLCTTNNTRFFITTHSHTSIDMFSGSSNAQILHIQKTLNGTTGTIFESNLHGYNILGDLGVRASDLLQANGLIWIEGPSDRIFLNKFISLWSNNELKEGKHFEFAFYGGSILANYDAKPSKENFENAIKVLNVNKNVIFICDSDRISQVTPLKDRVISICSDLDMSGSLYWVTEAKEIENYIPPESFEAEHPKQIKKRKIAAIGVYEPIISYLQNNGITTAKEYTEKARNAAAYARHFTINNLNFRSELAPIMTQICDKIKSWNHIKTPTN